MQRVCMNKYRIDSKGIVFPGIAAIIAFCPLFAVSQAHFDFLLFFQVSGSKSAISIFPKSFGGV